MAYDGNRPRDDDFVKESAELIRQNFEGLRTGGLVAPRPPLFGAGAPSATLGEAFDRYINTATGDEYYKGSGGWVRVSNLGQVYKTSAGVYYYATRAELTSAVGVVGDVGIIEGSLAQLIYVKESSGWTWKTTIPKGSEKYQDMGSISGTKNINAASGTIVKFTVSAALTITLTAAAEPGLGCTLTLLMRRGGAYTVTWPQSVAWAGGNTPTLSAAETDVVTLTTINGSDWIGTVAGAGAEEAVADIVIITASCSITAPHWATKALVSGCGAGGGGGADSRWALGNGSAGGVTSFGSLISITGGEGGNRATSSSSTGAAGVDGGPVSAAVISGKYGIGGTPGSGSGTGGKGGNGGAVINYYVDVVGGQTYTITIGQGGAGGLSDWGIGGPGTNGFLIIKWVA